MFTLNPQATSPLRFGMVLWNTMYSIIYIKFLLSFHTFSCNWHTEFFNFDAHKLLIIEKAVPTKLGCKNTHCVSHYKHQQHTHSIRYTYYIMYFTFSGCFAPCPLLSHSHIQITIIDLSLKGVYTQTSLPIIIPDVYYETLVLFRVHLKHDILLNNGYFKCGQDCLWHVIIYYLHTAY